MPLITRVSNQLGNAMSGCDVRDPAWRFRPKLTNREIGKLTAKGWVWWSHLYHRYRLTEEGEAAYDRWLRNRKENIKNWSRIYKLRVHGLNGCAALWDRDIRGNLFALRTLERWIVERMIDDGLLQYEDETDSWKAPLKSDSAAVQEDRRSVVA